MAESELVPPPADGRVFRHRVAAGLADVAPSGRARLDAIARWLQDAALADVVDSGLDGGGVWVLRRLRLCVARFPRFGDALEVRTFCSGTGTLVAERRSTVVVAGGEDEPAVEALALWVHLDPDGAHPRPLPEGFEAVYGATAAGRRVRARLRHPGEPPAGAAAAPWRFRAADLDIAGHVNNSVYWQVVEEELVGREPAGGLPGGLPHTARNTVVGGPRWDFDAEIEYRAPGDVGDAVVHAGEEMRWIAADGDVLATVRLPG